LSSALCVLVSVFFPIFIQPAAAFTQPAAAQDASVTAQPRTPVTLTLRLADGRRQFRPGEIISIQLEFNSATPKRFSVDGATYDRSGRLTIDEFVIDRIDDVSDSMLDYFGSIGGALGGLRSIGVLGEKPFTVKLELNEWFRFDQPGSYTLRVKSRRVTDEAVNDHAVVPVESNTVSFEILPRDATWEASELETARRLVEATPPPHDALRGCRIMRFLGTEAAVQEMIRRYGAQSDQGCDFEYMAGLFSAPNRAEVVRAMEGALRAADQPVTRSYLRTLSTLSVYLEHPEFRPAQTPETKGRFVAGELSRHFDLIDAAMSIYSDVLTAAMPDKTARARAITLAEAPAQRQGPPLAGPEASREQLAAAFLDLPAERQSNLLEYQWRSIAGPSILPALRRLVNSSPANAPSLADVALRLLAQLSPDEARPLLLREIQNPRRGATLKTLGMLPDAELPDLDDVLAGNLEASRTLDEAEIAAALVQRYGTRKIAQRILAEVDDRIGRTACRPQAFILAYFLRVDEVTGAGLLNRAMASRETGCWRFLNEIADVRMTPAVEERAIVDLDSPDPDVVEAAIKTLGHHGSPAALEPLRAAFQRWHVTWTGRAAELEYSHVLERPNAKEAMVEDAFRQAIGAGQGWLMRRDDLHALQSLCVTDNCRRQTGYMIHDDDTRIVVRSINGSDESNIELAQYRFTSIRSLEEQLARYPRGTAFLVERTAGQTDDVKSAITELEAFARSQGLSITER
jgi:hypothetical protein